MSVETTAAWPRWPIERLAANPRNYRSHPEAQIAALRANLSRHGQQKPVVIQSDGMILAGHALVEAARQLGCAEIGVHVYDGSDPGAFLVDDNESVRLAEDDDQALAVLLRERMEAGTLDSTGWGEDEVRALLERIEAEQHQAQGEDPGPGEAPAEPVTRPGDLWLLGEHRLLCGDCTVAADVDRPMAGEKAGCCVTSPPYAMQRASTYGGIPAADYPAWFLRVAAQVWRALDEAGSFFVNIKEHVEDGQRSLYVMRTVIAMVEAGWRYVDQLIWVKPGLPGEHYPRLRNDFEPIHFFARQDAVNWMVQVVDLNRDWLAETDFNLAEMYEDVFHFAKRFRIKFRPRAVGHVSEQVPQYRPGGGGYNPATGNISVPDQALVARGIARPGNVQHFGRNQESLAHPAMFPVALPAFFMRLTTEEGGLVYEPFSGSGTTIIAAEQNGRRCVAMELLPGYCDVAIERWQTMTGGQARHMETGKTFADHAHESVQVARNGAISQF